MPLIDGRDLSHIKPLNVTDSNCEQNLDNNQDNSDMSTKQANNQTSSKTTVESLQIPSVELPSVNVAVDSPEEQNITSPRKIISPASPSMHRTPPVKERVNNEARLRREVKRPSQLDDYVC